MPGDVALTFRKRLLVLAVVVCCTTLLFVYLITFVTPEKRRGRTRMVTSRFLKTKGGQQSLLEQRLATSPLQHNVTIVTAYLNIGSFEKGGSNNVFTPDLYRTWIKVFQRITNPVIAFFDNDRDVQMFRVLRNNLPKNMTKIVKISKQNTWAFSLRPTIEEIYSQAFYPKHKPNTVIPDYSCIMHAKYEFVSMAVEENPFATKYFAWLDIGLFRDLATKTGPAFSIHLPPKFNEKKVAYTEVYTPSKKPLTAAQIVRNNMVWVCGCFFIAKYDVMKRWTNQYRAFTEKMLRENWMSTDQQVLYYMFQPQHNKSSLIDVNVQTYQGDGRFNGWFHLGYVCAEHIRKNSARDRTTPMAINGIKTQSKKT